MNSSRVLLPVIAMVLAALTSGCLMSRVTTTERTAIEQELIGAAVERAIADFPQESLGEGSFFLLDDKLDKVDKEFLLSSLRLYLLRNGLREVKRFVKPDVEESPDFLENVDIIVEPRSSSVGVDDSEILIGIPEIQFGSGVGGFSTPELALFKRTTQRGRARVAAHGIRQSDGSMAFDLGPEHAETYYIRIKVLFIFGWRSTNLEKPY